MNNIIFILCIVLLIYYFYCDYNLNKKIDKFTNQKEQSITNKISTLVNLLDNMKSNNEQIFNDSVEIKGDLELNNINFKNNVNILPIGSITSFYGHHLILKNLFNLKKEKEKVLELLSNMQNNQPQNIDLLKEDIENYNNEINTKENQKKDKLSELNEEIQSYINNV